MFSKNNSEHRHLNTNRDYLKKYLLKLYPRTIQSIILISFTLVSSVCMLFLGMSMYQRFERRSRQMMTDNSLLMLARTTDSIEDYLRRMRRISASSRFLSPRPRPSASTSSRTTSFRRRAQPGRSSSAQRKLALPGSTARP